MATIDLIVLGMLKKESMGAYDIQKQVEYRQISKWVKISTPSIYKKVIQLEEKGFITSHIEKEGKMPEKSVYSLTEAGEREFERLMTDISCSPVNIFLDFNAVIVNLDSVPDNRKAEYIGNIENSIRGLMITIEENIAAKENDDTIPETGKTVLQQQYALIKAIEAWIAELKNEISKSE